jgi:hypothetical protein
VKYPRKPVEEPIIALVTVRVPKKHMRRKAIENDITPMWRKSKYHLSFESNLFTKDDTHDHIKSA